MSFFAFCFSKTMRGSRIPHIIFQVYMPFSSQVCLRCFSFLFRGLCICFSSVLCFATFVCSPLSLSSVLSCCRFFVHFQCLAVLILRFTHRLSRSEYLTVLSLIHTVGQSYQIYQSICATQCSLFPCAFFSFTLSPIASFACLFLTPTRLHIAQFCFSLLSHSLPFFSFFVGFSPIKFVLFSHQSDRWLLLVVAVSFWS